jgi:hypothetical protein
VSREGVGGRTTNIVCKDVVMARGSEENRERRVISGMTGLGRQGGFRSDYQLRSEVPRCSAADVLHW